jgi:ABC-type Fe3+ transport system permease subunit
MDELTTSARRVPLEAGAGPDNPPCPACGEPLFGWLADEDRLGAPVRRCESCGLGIVGESTGSEEALHALDRLGDQERARIHNRASLACSIGGAGWAGLVPGVHYLFTIEAVRRLVAQRDQVVRRRRWAPGPSFAQTWQTLLNSVTFGHNVALAALGSGTAAPAEEPWQRRIDALASIVLAIPAAIIAVPVELTGALFRSGAVVDLRFELL